MPTYEYRCPKGHAFDLFQRMSDEPRAECPTCGEEAQRVLSAGAGFLFRGEGFYITDYRSDAYRKASAAESGKGEGSGGSSASPSSGDSASAPASASDAPSASTTKPAPARPAAGASPDS